MATKANKQSRQRTQQVTTGSPVRIEVPKSSRQPKQKVTVVVGPEINPVGGFIDFMREHAVVGLATGFIIGQQAQTLVKQLVSSFINPAFQLLFGKALSVRTFTLHWHNRAADFGWGAFIYGVLQFLFVLFAIYLIFKSLKLDQLDKPKKKEA